MTVNPTDVVSAVLDRQMEVGDEKLNDAERVVYLVSEFEFELLQGGLHVYFWNSSGLHANEMHEVMKTIGATRCARAFGEVLDLFPGGRVPSEREELQSLINQIQEKHEKQFDDLYARLSDECLGELLEARERYILEHLDELPSQRTRPKVQPKVETIRKQATTDPTHLHGITINVPIERGFEPDTAMLEQAVQSCIESAGDGEIESTSCERDDSYNAISWSVSVLARDGDRVRTALEPIVARLFPEETSIKQWKL